MENEEYAYIPEGIRQPLNGFRLNQYEGVFRAVYNSELSYRDFIPWILDPHTKKSNPFAQARKLECYGVSLFLDPNKLKKLLSTNALYVGVAKGFTSAERGVCSPQNKETHVDYYLKDYVNNSPAPDFVFLQEGGGH